MEDNRFDDILKGKVGEFEDPQFDPSALADLHQRMATVPSALPWHVRYGKELFYAATLSLFAAVIIWSQWYFHQQDATMLNATLEIQSGEIKDLQDQLRNYSTKTDTVRIVEIRNIADTAMFQDLYQRLVDLEKAQVEVINDHMMFLGSNDQVPPDILNTLAKNGLLIEHEDGVYLVAYPVSSTTIQPKQHAETNESIPRYAFVYTEEDDLMQEEKKLVPIPIKTQRELAKHYGKGVGINVGPMLDFSFANFSVGESDPSVGFGVLADFILSPTLSLETGAKLVDRHTEVESNFGRLSLPNENDTENLSKVEIDNQVIEFPLNLKYRYLISTYTQIIGSAGYTAMLYASQDIEYTYPASGNLLSIQDESIESSRLYPGGLNFSVGLNRALQKNNSLETTLFYHHGIGDKGRERNNANFIGLRGVYWIRVR